MNSAHVGLTCESLYTRKQAPKKEGKKKFVKALKGHLCKVAIALSSRATLDVVVVTTFVAKCLIK